MKWEELFYVKLQQRKDFGVTMNANMKLSEQFRIAASRDKPDSWNDSEKYKV